VFSVRKELLFTYYRYELYIPVLTTRLCGICVKFSNLCYILSNLKHRTVLGHQIVFQNRKPLGCYVTYLRLLREKLSLAGFRKT